MDSSGLVVVYGLYIVAAGAVYICRVEKQKDKLHKTLERFTMVISKTPQSTRMWVDHYIE